MGLVERVKLHYGGFIERRIEKKYENVMRPVYLPKYDKWVVDTEIQRKRRQSRALSKKERESIPGAETGDIIWVLGELARTGLSYRFWTASARKSGYHEHAHWFSEVLSFLADDPGNFEIDESFRSDYSAQELEYISAVQKKYAEIDSEQAKDKG